ncbi:SDR family NAD(P)-dependent oxidoreductase [Paraburkholderia caribensis]|uniref:3-hydroxy-2-methylbutyryl-CoA dehydrogenase n=1 Tax=Paraburkholderia caribensis TaxID=75105 RepID=A0A9Q6S7W5_9BURK|nr:SDR family NAD(P)-dependent oxidoreductase [Paraburkholderia caribensis]MCO4880109.1 SDR family NAD(P)-dependent oxidoreductase [Paraburkholderia caribensis]PTB26268.1 3-hydroxyacyl-CoA dehydrogenase [Paraburkholderia caribensis]QLB66113.1 3-hydroxy-2-methylbutyryl-CoA dehydrogenase [Paraburkholderia caribensis]
MQIKNRGFIVTGGGSGLGAATARRLVQAGAAVLLVDQNLDTVAAVAQELGPRALAARADVTDAADVQAAVQAFRDAFGNLHGLVNCAGVAPAEKVLGRNGPHSLEAFARTVQINLIGTFNVLRLAADEIARNESGEDGERGVIVNTASVAAFDGQIGQAGYAASKGGVVAMTLPIARELARVGIRVVTVAPGIMETPMLTGMSAEVQQGLGQTIPFPSRLGRPDEFARLVLHIAENSYINGEVIRLDGAIRMAPK